MVNDSLRIRLSTVWIRVRSWLSLGKQLGAIALFLVGVFATYRSRTAAGHIDPSLFGYEIPAVLGFTAHETLTIGGITVMMVGIGLAYRWTISDRHGYATV